MPRHTASTPTVTLAWGLALLVLTPSWSIDVLDLKTTKTTRTSASDIVPVHAVSTSNQACRGNESLRILCQNFPPAIVRRHLPRVRILIVRVPNPPQLRNELPTRVLGATLVATVTSIDPIFFSFTMRTKRSGSSLAESTTHQTLNLRIKSMVSLRRGAQVLNLRTNGIRTLLHLSRRHSLNRKRRLLHPSLQCLLLLPSPQTQEVLVC